MGGQWRNSSFLLPSNLEQIGAIAGIAPARLLWDHTVFPYVTAFKPPNEVLRLERQVLSRPSPGTTKSLASLCKSVTHGVSHRRICLDCVKHELTLHGETYWHRSHILPGVHRCSIHGSGLRETNIPVRDSLQRILVMPDELSSHAYSLQVDSKTLDHLMVCSVSALAYTHNKSEDWAKNYHNLALLLGYGLVTGEIASTQLAQDIWRFFGGRFLSEMGCFFDRLSPHPWTETLVRVPSAGSCCPRKHLLLQTFFRLYDNLEEPDCKDAGPKLLPSSAQDERCLIALKTQLEMASSQWSSLTFRQLLKRVGYWNSFKCHRSEFPLTSAFLLGFPGSAHSGIKLARDRKRSTRLCFHREKNYR